jgi:hypothetical protein
VDIDENNPLCINTIGVPISTFETLPKGIQAVGEGVQKASQSASADTILQVLYPPGHPAPWCMTQSQPDP